MIVLDPESVSQLLIKNYSAKPCIANIVSYRKNEIPNS